MSDTRQHAHNLIDRMPEAQLNGLVRFLETIVEPAASRVPLEDERSATRKSGPCLKRASG